MEHAQQFSTLMAEQEVLIANLKRIFHAWKKSNALHVNTQLYKRVQSLDIAFTDTLNSFQPLSPLLDVNLKSDETVLTNQTVFEEMFYEMTAALETAVNPSNETTFAANPHVSLPKLNLTVFSGHVSEWQAFISTYDSLIHNTTTLTGVQKLQYLRNSLRGPALALINALPLVEENYEIAYTTLQDRYANSRRLAHHYFNQIRDFKREPAPSHQFYQNFLSTHTNNISALKRIYDPQFDCEDFLLFSLALNNLDALTKADFEKSMHVGTFPKYKDLIDFITCKARAFELMDPPSTNVSSTAPSTSNNSTAVSQKLKSLTIQASSKPNAANYVKFPCFFCPSDSHSIFTCQDFLLLSIDDRYENVRRLRRCFGCLGNHNRQTCRSNSRCKQCDSPRHHTLLHPQAGIGQSQAGIRFQPAPHKQVNFSSKENQTLTFYPDTPVRDIRSAAVLPPGANQYSFLPPANEDPQQSSHASNSQQC